MGTIVKTRSTVRLYSTAPQPSSRPCPGSPIRYGDPIKKNGASPKARPVNQLSNTRKNKSEFKKDESQWIEAQRPLSAPTIPRFDWIVCPGFPRPTMRTALNTDPFNGKQGTCDTRSKPFTFVPGLMGRKTNTAYQHGF